MLPIYNKNSIVTIRKNFRTKYGVGIGIITVIESGTSAGDPFKRSTYKYSTARWVSGTGAWITSSERRFSQGGITDDAEVRIVIDLSEKDNIKVKNTHLQWQNINLEIRSYDELEDTRELLILARRMS